MPGIAPPITPAATGWNINVKVNNYEYLTTVVATVCYHCFLIECMFLPRIRCIFSVFRLIKEIKYRLRVREQLRV